MRAAYAIHGKRDSMPAPCTESVRRNPSNGNARAAAMPAAFAASITAVFINLRDSNGAISNLVHGRMAHQSAGPEEQHQNQNREDGDVFISDAEIARPQRFDDTDQKTAEHCT